MRINIRRGIDKVYRAWINIPMPELIPHVNKIKNKAYYNPMKQVVVACNRKKHLCLKEAVKIVNRLKENK